MLLINLTKEIKEEVSLECVGYSQHVYLFVTVGERWRQTVQSLVYASFPETEIDLVPDYVARIDPCAAGIARHISSSCQ